MLNLALFSSVKDDWPTPWEFFHNLDLEFDFTLDVCAVPWSAKVWLPKSFMAENTVFLLLTALIRNFYKAIIQRLDVKRFGLNATSRIKAFVFRFVSVPAKWIRTSRRYVLNIYTCNNAYADIFQTDFG